MAAESQALAADSARANAQRIGELIGEVRAIAQSVRDSWAKLNELSGYVHKTRHDFVDLSNANSNGLVLLRKDVENLSAAVKELAIQNQELAKCVGSLTSIATQGKGAWWMFVKIGAGIIAAGAVLVSLKQIFGSPLP